MEGNNNSSHITVSCRCDMGEEEFLPDIYVAFHVFLVASLLSLLCSLWFRYGLFGHPIQQTRKKILLFFFIAAVDILFYKIVVEITRIFFPAFFVSAFFVQWTLSWGASIWNEMVMFLLLVRKSYFGINNSTLGVGQYGRLRMWCRFVG